jgi:rod shape-determining protein MreC
LRNIFLFIRRYFTFITFVVLQITALSFLFRYNKFHRAIGLGIANEATGKINAQYNRVEDYFELKKENLRLHRTNDSLLNVRLSNFLTVDTAQQVVQDSIPYDTLGSLRRYLWRDAQVISNSVRFDKNYIQLNRGSAQGIRDNMAVISSDLYAVGVVVNVSDNFSQVMSLLHVQSQVSSSLKRTGEIGNLSWKGKDPRYLTLTEIPQNVEVKQGDTIVTSRYSDKFPPGYMIGTIDEITVEKSTGTYILKIKTAVNFYNLQQVHVVENLIRNEQVQLDKDTKKKVEQPKKTK